MEMDSRPLFNHLHPELTFPMSASLDPGPRAMIALTQSRGSSLIHRTSGPDMDITPPALDEEEFHSNSDDDGKPDTSPGLDGLSPTGDKKKYPDYCRTLKIKDANGAVRELVFPKALDLDRPKRARTQFSAEQLYQLEREFQRNQYLVGRERTDLAIKLGLSETQVKVWFQNRRTKYKRDKSREQEERQNSAESVATCNLLRMLHPQKPDVSVGGSTSLQVTSGGHAMQHPAMPPSVNYPPSSLPSPLPPHPCMPTAIRPHMGPMGLPPMHFPASLPGFFNS